jgi:carbon-monoxide dehydrogenase small subunit
VIIVFSFNGEEIKVENPGNSYLSTWLREKMGVKSIHEGCKRGQCGQCLVLVDNTAVPSCLIPLFNLHGTSIETIEGILQKPGFMDIEKGFAKALLNPCPHCAGVKTVLAEGLLRLNRPLLREQILENMPGLWCQCSPVEAFINAVIMAGNFRKERLSRVRS